jgi:ribonucleotide monophosphatase NagD (HAD superfamily)
VAVVTDPGDAAFIVAHGTEALAQPAGPAVPQSLGQLTDLLQRCAAKGGMPLICANPDLVSCCAPPPKRKPRPRAWLICTHCLRACGRGGALARFLQVTVDGDALITMPGTLAHAYQQMGGQVVLMGKPAPLIYAAATSIAPQVTAAPAARRPHCWQLPLAGPA